MFPDTTRVVSTVDDNITQLPVAIPLNVICHPLVYIFIPVPLSPSASHFIAPDTFIADNDHSASHITSVFSVHAPFTRRKPFEFVFHLLTPEESYDSIIDPDITTRCPDVPVCTIPPVIVRSVPSYVNAFVDPFPMDSLYVAPEYPMKNHVPVLYAVCPPRMSPFVLSTIAPA